MEQVLARRAGHAARRQAKRGGGLVWTMDLTAAGIVLGTMWLAGRLPALPADGKTACGLGRCADRRMEAFEREKCHSINCDKLRRISFPWLEIFRTVLPRFPMI